MRLRVPSPNTFSGLEQERLEAIASMIPTFAQFSYGPFATYPAFVPWSWLSLGLIGSGIGSTDWLSGCRQL